MVRFDDLHITPDGQNLIIDVSIPDVPYYEDEDEEISVTLGDIYIINQDQYKDTGSYKAEGNHIWHIDVPEGLKTYRVSLTNREICNIDKSLLFVIAEAVGEPRSDTPCGQDEQTTIAAIYHKGHIAQRFMHAIKQVEKRCDLPKDYIDFMLRLEAVNFAIESAHYALAAKYWKKYIMPPHHLSPHHFHDHPEDHVHLIYRDDSEYHQYQYDMPEHDAHYCSSCHGNVHF